MNLAQQIQILIYHFIGGSCFALIFSFLSLVLLHMRLWGRIVILNIFCLCFTCLFYYGLYQINYGITHLYAWLVFLLGLFLYYQWGYGFFLPFFLFIVKILSFFVQKGRLAKKKMYVIIKNGKGNKDSRKKERIRWKKSQRARNAQ